MRRLLLLSTVLLPTALAPAAQAATVEFQDAPRKVRFDAAAGEANALTIEQTGTTVTLTDTGAGTIDVARGDTDCVALSASEARCEVPVTDFRIDAQLGDGADTVTTRLSVPVNVDGGEGDDVLDVRDGVRGDVLCGAGVDTGRADLEDQLVDCEGVEQPLLPPAVGTEEPGAPAGDAAFAEPERGKSVAVAVKQGVVYVRRPGSAAAVPLDPTLPVPVGSVLDATRGVLTLTVATAPAGVARAAQAAPATQTADFTGARFVVGQRAGSAATELKMTGGSFAACGTARAAARGSAFAASKRRVRSLWGSGHGRFTTRGRNSAATVRGTIWRVTDRCDGTLTTVTRGVVVVEDFGRDRTKVVRAGESYFARRR